MLPKSERFTKKDFLGVKPQVFFRGTYFDVSLVKNNQKKFACVISKKRIKRAVDRNKARRKIYNIIQVTENTVQNSLIFYPKQTILNSQRPLIVEELRKVFATL